MLREEDETAKRGDDGEVTNKRQLDEYRSGEEYMAYEALCRNETIKVSVITLLLVCYCVKLLKFVSYFMVIGIQFIFVISILEFKKILPFKQRN